MKRSNNAIPSRRDKRYASPRLLISFFQESFHVENWTMYGFVINNYKGSITTGDKFTLFFVMKGENEHGVMQVQAVTLRDNNLSVNIIELDDDGRAMMLAQKSNKEGISTLIINAVYPTYNWSLTGCLLTQYNGALKANTLVRGTIYGVNNNNFSIFEGKVVRVDINKRTLALKFNNLNPDTFTLLEKSVMHVLQTPT